MRGDSDADVRVLGVFFQADDVVGLVLRYQVLAEEEHRLAILIDQEDEAAEVLPNILEPLIIETPFNYQVVILAIPTDVLGGIALDMIGHREHLNCQSTLYLPQTYTLEKVLAAFRFLFHQNMIGFLLVKES